MLATVANIALVTPQTGMTSKENDIEFSLELLQYLAEFSEADGELIDPETMQPLSNQADLSKSKLSNRNQIKTNCNTKQKLMDNPDIINQGIISQNTINQPKITNPNNGSNQNDKPTIVHCEQPENHKNKIEGNHDENTAKNTQQQAKKRTLESSQRSQRNKQINRSETP